MLQLAGDQLARVWSGYWPRLRNGIGQCECGETRGWAGQPSSGRCAARSEWIGRTSVVRASVRMRARSPAEDRVAKWRRESEKCESPNSKALFTLHAERGRILDLPTVPLKSVN